MKQFTEAYVKYLKETPKGNGKPYSKSYIKNVKYQIDRLDEPITVESINDFVKKSNVHPSTATAIQTFYIWYRWHRLDKETRKKAKRELDREDKFFYIPPAKPKRYTKWEKDLTFEEKKKLILESEYPWNMIFRLAFDTMLRKEEFLSIDVKNINFRDNYVIVSSIKGGEPDVRYFWPSTKEAILDYMKRENITSGKLLTGFTTSTKHKVKFTSYTFWYYFNQISMKVIGRKFNPHWVRNTEAQLMKDMGHGKEEAKERGGWKDDQTLEQVYSGSSLSSKKKAFEKASVEVK